MKWLLALMLWAGPLTAQDSVVAVIRSSPRKCVDSTAVLLRQVLALEHPKSSIWRHVRDWAPVALTLALVIYGTRTKVVYVDRLVPAPEKPHDDDDDEGHHH